MSAYTAKTQTRTMAAQTAANAAVILGPSVAGRVAHLQRREVDHVIPGFCCNPQLLLPSGKRAKAVRHHRLHAKPADGQRLAIPTEGRVHKEGSLRM